MEIDLEEELMDLTNNEFIYMPSSSTATHPRRPLSSYTATPRTNSLVQQVTEQLVAQATQLQQTQNEMPPPKPIPSNVDEQLLTADQLQYLAQEDARLEKRRTVVKELTASRQAKVARRLDNLVLQLEQLQQTITERIRDSDDAVEDNERRRRGTTQLMTAKLDFVLEHSALELQLVDEDVDWTRLLEELPMEEREYLGRVADQQFEEQMKYLRGEREREREGAIRQHLHGILVLTASQRNGQTLAKTSMHHSLRHLLQDFAKIFRGCYANFLQHGDQGVDVRTGVSVDRVTCTLPLVAADVTQFAAILTQVVLFKYPFLQNNEFQRSAVQRSVLTALFDALQPVLHGLYVASFQREDAIVDDVAELSRTNPLEYFEVKPLFRLDRSWSGAQEEQFGADRKERRLLTLRHYNAAIHHMNNLASERSPYAKLERLAYVCEEIDHAIKIFYESYPAEIRPSSEQLSMCVM